MSSELPNFILCHAACNPSADGSSDNSCVSDNSLDRIICERWQKTLEGAQPLAKDLLGEWDMANKPPLLVGDKQIFVYVPPCGPLVEAALAFSIKRAETNKAVFAEEIEKGKSFPSLPCAIRIDERLGAGSCAVEGTQSRMRGMLDYLQRCAANTYNILGMERLLLTPLHPGPWAANHFDVQYLDRTCHELNSVGSETVQESMGKDLTLEEIALQTPRSHYKTGNLIVADAKPVNALLERCDPSTSVKSRPQNMVCVKRVDDQRWYVSYYGSYVFTRPTTHAEDYQINHKSKKYGKFK